MKAPLSYVPALPAALGITTGILSDSLGAGIATMAVGVVLFITFYIKRLHYPALFALMVTAGAVLAVSHCPVQAPVETFSKKHTFVGEIVETREGLTTTTYTVKNIKVDSVRVGPFLSSVTVNSVSSPKEPGAIIEYVARLQPLTIDEEVPHEVDYTKYMKAEGITSRCFLNDTVKELFPPNGLRALSNRARDNLYNAIVDSPVDGSTAAFLVASIIGDRRFLSREEYSEYSDTGVAHVLALSGLHVGIIASILGMMMFPLRFLQRGFLIGNTITALFIWAYAVIAGFTPSIIRAATMITLFIISRMIQRGSNGFNSLLLSIVVILCINPAWLFTPGFQLSVSAVASILLFGGVIPSNLRRRPVLWFLLNLIVVPVSAMLGTGIISAFYFNVFPLLFIVSNIITGILFPFIIGGGIFLAIFTACGVKFSLLGWIIDGLHSLMQCSLTTLGHIEGSTLRNVYFSAWVILPYSVAMIFLAISLRYRKRTPWIMTGAMTILTIIIAIITKERVPLAEMYIPSSLKPTTVIMRSADKAWIYTTQKGQISQELLEEANTRYRRFLLSRGCEETFDLTTDSLDHITFKVRNSMIAAIDKTIAVVGEHMPDVTSGNIHIDYALICDGFKASASHVFDTLHPDTLLLGTELHPSLRARLIRQCGDSIPYINLSKESFSLVR